MKIFNSFINYFKAPNDIEPLSDEEQIKKTYSHFRMRIFYSCFIGYIVYNICRKNITVALPLLSSEYGFTNVQLGLLGSSLYLTYGIGKFVNGMVADNADVRKFMSIALIFSGIANICFALSAQFITPNEVSFFGLPPISILLWVLAFFWGANGFFQSMGFPPIAKSLTYWFSKSERGSKWSIWSTSHQIGVYFAVVISGFAVKYWGLNGIFIVPGALCILTGIWLLERLRDKPSTVGLPEIEKYRNEEPTCQVAAAEEDSWSYLKIFRKYILFNKTIWLLAIAYVFVYIVRYGTEDWVIKYLVEVKHDDITLATHKLSFLAFAGIFGAILASVFSDKLFKGKRMPINLIFLFGVGLCIALLPFSHNNVLDIILVSLIGFFTAGPQLLIGGLCAVESSSKKVASASVGFTGIFGYVGAVLSSTGTGYAIDKYSWNGALIFWSAAAVICFVICIPLLIDEYKKCKQD